MTKYELNSKYILKTDNNNLAIDLADIKDYLKIDNTIEDNLLISLIKTATLLIEKYTRRELLNKTFSLYLDFFPNYRGFNYYNSNTIQVKRSKLQSITSIKYYLDNVLTVLDSNLYSFTKSNDYSEIYLINNNSLFPSTDNRNQAVEIEFIAGYGDTNISIPEDLKQAIKLIVSYMYANRGDCDISISNITIINLSGTNVILDIYRILEI